MRVSAHWVSIPEEDGVYVIDTSELVTFPMEDFIFGLFLGFLICLIALAIGICIYGGCVRDSLSRRLPAIDDRDVDLFYNHHPDLASIRTYDDVKAAREPLQLMAKLRGLSFVDAKFLIDCYPAYQYIANGVEAQIILQGMRTKKAA